MDRIDVRYVQIGSFFEVYSMEDGFFFDLKDDAEKCGVRIKSCFTTHRELGGFFSGNSYMERAARKNYEQYIHAASLLGADYIGSNPGTVPRDRMETKGTGIACYLKHMKELMELAKEKGLKGLTMEPMSSLAEPPTLPEELDYMLGTLSGYHQDHPDTTVPVYVCGDISHGYADQKGRIIHTNMDLFEHQIPWTAEFHFKNTDRMFSSTFGFSEGERQLGIVDLGTVRSLIEQNSRMFPVDHLVGYYETGGPKMGREYSDYLLEKELTTSIQALRAVFSGGYTLS